MRSLSVIALLSVSCAGPKEAVRAEQAPFDPELYEACTPDGPDDPSAVCPRDDEGNWKTSRPPSSVLLAGKDMFENGHHEMAVRTLGQAISYERLEDDCGRLYARWLRGQSHYALGKYPEALKDFGFIVQAGPDNPFYRDVDDWLKKLEGKVPSGALSACRAQYRPERIKE
jgi:hypothetical protein